MKSLLSIVCSEAQVIFYVCVGVIEFALFISAVVICRVILQQRRHFRDCLPYTQNRGFYNPFGVLDLICYLQGGLECVRGVRGSVSWRE